MPPQPQRIAVFPHRVTTPPAPAESADNAAEDIRYDDDKTKWIFGIFHGELGWGAPPMMGYLAWLGKDIESHNHFSFSFLVKYF